ncbi:MAG: sensor histidine kinase, partial [Flavobacteriales bacterium]
LYLIAKEAAHNAFKYSGADRVDLLFVMDTDHFRLELRDNGRGLGEVGSEGGGHGLVNMQQRASELGCQLIMDAPLGGGTCIRLVGPVSALDL